MRNTIMDGILDMDKKIHALRRSYDRAPHGWQRRIHISNKISQDISSQNFLNRCWIHFITQLTSLSRLFHNVSVHVKIFFLYRKQHSIKIKLSLVKIHHSLFYHTTRRFYFIIFNIIYLDSSEMFP